MALNRDPQYIKWSARLESLLKSDTVVNFDDSKLRLSLYRPFTKKWLYYDDPVIERTRLFYKQFGINNEVIFTTGRGASKKNSLSTCN